MLFIPRQFVCNVTFDVHRLDGLEAGPRTAIPKTNALEQALDGSRSSHLPVTGDFNGVLQFVSDDRDQALPSSNWTDHQTDVAMIASRHHRVRHEPAEPFANYSELDVGDDVGFVQCRHERGEHLGTLHAFADE